MSEYKSWRNENRTWLKDVVPLDTPYNLHVDVSSVCNIRCIYCGQNANPGKELMSMEMFKKIINEARKFPHKLKLLDLYYTGEPLCNSYFADMVEYAKKANIADNIGVTTNGLLLNSELSDKIISSGLDIIRISIQGVDAATYKKICGVHMDFTRFINNLKYLYRHKGQCSIRIKTVDIALKDKKNGEKIFRDIFSPIADRVFIEHVIPIYSGINYDQIDASIDDHSRNGRYDIAQSEIHKVCYRPFIKMLVATNGDVGAACCDHIAGKDIIYGNINSDNTLMDIWNGEKRKIFLKFQLQGKRFEHELCKNCVVPNDIVNDKDLLDPWAEEVIKRF